MIKHPAAACTPAQRAAFERIAASSYDMDYDDTADIKERTVDELEKLGLIRTGLEHGKRYCFVPVDIYWKWCEWCAERYMKR